MGDYLAAFKSHDSGGVQYVNTFAIHVEPTLISTDEPPIGTVATKLRDWQATQYRKCLHTQYTLDSIDLRRILGAPEEATVAIGAAGTYNPAGATKCPKELCMVVTIKTAHATRRGRGRVFIPSPRSTDALADPTSFVVTTDPSTYWHEVSVLFDEFLEGQDFVWGTLGSETAHMSLRVYSRKDAATYDATGYVQRTAYHWLRSRATAP